MAELLKIEGFATKEIALQQKPINEILKESEGVLISFTKANVKKNLTALVKKHSKEIDELIAKDQLTTKEENRLKELRAIYKEPRIALDKITKHNSSVLSQASKSSKVVKDELTLIVEPTEDKITKRLESEEKRRENARIEKENQETERKAKLQSIVDVVAADLQSIIDSTKEFSQIKENETKFDTILIDFDDKISEKEVDLQEYDLVYQNMTLEKSEAFDALIKSLTTANDLEISNKALEVSRLTNERMSELFDYDYKYKGEKALGELSIKDYEIELKCAKFYFRKKSIEAVGLVGNEALKSWIYATETDVILVQITFDELNNLSDEDFKAKIEYFKSEIEDWNNQKEAEIKEETIDNLDVIATDSNDVEIKVNKIGLEIQKEYNLKQSLKNNVIYTFPNKIEVEISEKTTEAIQKNNYIDNISAIDEKEVVFTSESKINNPFQEDRFQELFNYLSNELGVTALLSQLQDIETIVLKMQ